MITFLTKYRRRDSIRNKGNNASLRSAIKWVEYIDYDID